MKDDSITKFEEELLDVEKWFREEIASLRTGRASPALVEDLQVEYYGAKTPLKHIASISSPDARSLVIQPWDKGALETIGKAIESSSLNIAPIADRDHIRLMIPQLTEERRMDLIKVLNAKTEDARIRGRRSRDDIWKDVQQREKEKTISEDDKYRLKEELQKRIDMFQSELESIQEKKEKDIRET